MYCVRADLESYFGPTAILQWANMTGSASDEDIAARIAEYIAWAGDEIDSELRGGPYPVPFTTPYPHVIWDVCRKLAGTEMYAGRGAQDIDTGTGEVLDRYTPVRNQCAKKLKRILSGQVVLDLTTGVRSAPYVRRVALPDAGITATTVP